MTTENETNACQRPVDYTPELAETICDRLANYETLREICAERDMPDRESVVRWLAQHVEFRDDYADMRYWQSLDLAEEAILIVDDVPTEGLERVQGGKVVRTSLRYALARAVLRCDIRHWVADRLLPEAPPSWFWADERK
jgi:hypothetical protein